MKTLITFYSETGNTEKIALAIYDEIEGEKTFLRMTEIKSLNNYDLVFIGFPIHNFRPVSQAIKFMTNNMEGKKVALFTTMSLTAVPINDQRLELYNYTIENCKKCLPNGNLQGIFDCPGELSEQTANALLASDDKKLRIFGALRSLTIGFPTEKNISDARLFARKMCAKSCFI